MSDEKAIRNLKREKAFWKKVILSISVGIAEKEYVHNTIMVIVI